MSSYYNWDKQNRPIILLLEKYFSKNELEEFIQTGKIEKLELIKDKSANEVKEAFKVVHNEKIIAQIEELKKQLV